MNFDIKDVKSWANRHDVKVGDEGYFADNIEELKENNRTRMIAEILDDHAFCFRTPTNRYSFFLPLEAVKEDKPKEKKYRPFKNLYEFYQFLSFNSYITEEDFTPVMLLDLYFKYREKKALRVASTIVINRIDVDLKGICEPIIEGRNLERWFDLAEIMNDDGEWQPFGVEVKENDSD
jgi:hypothetical protein